LSDYQERMRRDWNQRCRENAKWFINTFKKKQTEAEFDESGRFDVRQLLGIDLDLLSQGRNTKDLKLLEIGCGIGRMTRSLADIFGKVYATDVSNAMVQKGAKRLSDIKNVVWHTTNGETFDDFPDKAFDLIFCAFVYQHVPSREVIQLNIRDAYRLLKPGALYKFQTNGVSHSDFQQEPKDTWMGDAFGEEEIRQLARELGAQLISIKGAGSQYCWSILRKPAVRTRTEQYPKIIDFAEEEQGDGAVLVLFVQGLDREVADVNLVSLTLNGIMSRPCYVGPVRAQYHPSLASRKEMIQSLTQIEVLRPTDYLKFNMEVEVVLSEGTTAMVSIQLTTSISPLPRITLVANNHDGGLDIYEKGEKSRIRVFFNALKGGFTSANTIVVIDDLRIIPEQIRYLPQNGLYMLEAQLPPEITKGRKRLALCAGDLQTEAMDIMVLSARRSFPAIFQVAKKTRIKKILQRAFMKPVHIIRRLNKGKGFV
jgi:SAM-dependent methyltransferase